MSENLNKIVKLIIKMYSTQKNINIIIDIIGHLIVLTIISKCPGGLGSCLFEGGV